MTPVTHLTLVRSNSTLFTVLFLLFFASPTLNGKEDKTNNGSSALAPTGCYKCGRAGHWSRDYTFYPTTSKPPNFPSSATRRGKQQQQEATHSAEVLKVKKLPRNDDLDYILEHIPYMLHLKRPGHEVSDLGNLIEAFIQWHSRMNYLRELRERVARGENPKTLHELPPVEPTSPIDGIKDFIEY